MYFRKLNSLAIFSTFLVFVLKQNFNQKLMWHAKLSFSLFVSINKLDSAILYTYNLIYLICSVSNVRVCIYFRIVETFSRIFQARHFNFDYSFIHRIKLLSKLIFMKSYYETVPTTYLGILSKDILINSKL